MEWNHQMIYALQHDQMKGFDYLAPQRFFDAIDAYGLLPSIIDLVLRFSFTCTTSHPHYSSFLCHWTTPITMDH